jgi:glycine cleavage system H protein
MMRPADRRYTETHEWALNEGGLVVTGITDFAVEQLGDLTYLELPEAGQEVKKGEPYGEIESVKTVSELYAPVTGKVAQVNEELKENLEKLQQDAYGEGWLIKIEPATPEEFESLLTAEQYERLCQEQEEAGQ